LYYVLYIFFIAVAQLGLSGFSVRYGLRDLTYNTDIIIFCSVISGLSALKFSSKFILLKEYAPRLNKGLILFYFGYTIVFFTYFAGLHVIAFRLLDLLGLVVSIYALWFSIYVSAQGYRPAKFFLIAWIFFIGGLLVFILRSYGVIPSSVISNSALQWGSAIEALLLSFALADRINILKREKELSQAEALEIAQENERIIKEQNTILERKVNERTKELKSTNEELNKTLDDLKEAQTQLVESEKMASLGQLTAGIAHEINNPINFVTSNVNPLKRDVDILMEIIEKITLIACTGIEAEEKIKQIEALKKEYDFDYLQEEIAFLLKGINEGSTRTAEIVKGLRIFSRVDEDDLKKADINEGLDSTIIIINNSLNGRIQIAKNYGNIPLAECYPGKLNQVFLNLISNAIYAIKTKFNDDQGGVLTISTEHVLDTIKITISDNGIGMDETTHKKLFEPFFTTKPVGEGTGLGLSISYNTIKKHNGTIHAQSELNVGTSFIIEIPIIQPNN
jgi:signal transduction histidine kinase